MPELPEVETVKRSLASSILGEKITEVTIYYSGNIRQPEPELFRQMLKRRVFEGIERRGKFLVFTLSGGLAMVVHLRMTGQLLYLNSKEPLEKHTHLVFDLSGGHQLRYLDLRKFGTFDLVPLKELADLKGLSKLGVEPLSSAFTIQWLADCLQRKNRPIKNFLLDQAAIAGIGNIYADEILFEAGIHPQKGSGELTQPQINKLYQSIIRLLKLGIDHRGTSIRNYVDGDGRQGSFQELLQVYGHKGEPCTRCGFAIAKVKQAGRGTYYCPNCQPGN